MTRPPDRSAVLAVALAACACLAVLALASGPAAAHHDDEVDDYVVVQGDTCVELEALGDGSTQNATEFYDYRWGSNTEFSSYGTTHLQKRDVSQFFLYHGSEGLSLVFVNDRLEENGSDTEHGNGGSITMEFEGLPEGEWPVMNDDYPEDEVHGGNNVDRLNHEGSTAQVDWTWVAGRTTGGVFTGVDGLGRYDSIDVTPRFAEESWAYQEDVVSYADHMNDLQVRHGEGNDELVSLSEDEPFRIERGTCFGGGDGEDGDGEFSVGLNATPSPVPLNEAVSLGADVENPDGDVEYRWDVDGDGATDRTTSQGSITVEYDEPGSLEPSVVATDENGTERSASTELTVLEPPSVEAQASVEEWRVEPGESVAFDGSESTTDDEIVSYEWDFGDGETATGPTAEHVYDTHGVYTAALTVTTDRGATDTANVSVEVEAPITLESLELQTEEVTAGEEAILEAAYRNDGDETVSTEVAVTVGDEVVGEENVSVDPGETETVTATHVFEEPGTYTFGVGGEQRTVDVAAAEDDRAAGGVRTVGILAAGLLGLTAIVGGAARWYGE